MLYDEAYEFDLYTPESNQCVRYYMKFSADKLILNISLDNFDINSDFLLSFFIYEKRPLSSLRLIQKIAAISQVFYVSIF